MRYIAKRVEMRRESRSDELQRLQIVDERHRRRRTGGEVRTTKSGKSHVFPIQVDLQRVLKTLPRSSDGRVFHGPLGGRLKADVVRRALICEVLAKLRDRFPTHTGEIGFINGRLQSFRHFRLQHLRRAECRSTSS
jgi:hypothetical protein